MAEQRSASTPRQSTTKTEGAIKAGGGRYTFDLAKLNTIDAGPGYSTAHGPVIEGERIQIGLLESEVDGVKSRVPAGSLIYIPANVVHSALATPDADVVFLTAKDMSHGIVGTPVDTSISAPLYAPGFEPKKQAAVSARRGPGSRERGAGSRRAR
ncbi:MAG: hypothetical protein AUH20_02275 [Candidatus Rokubacteria bacterium 13_2_20CM_69_15_2]|nr:MAG: hypothetical protein AUH20_02275 [Candidatus Rokubacteria bacterium 13_2_20CM_69_15_2]